MRRKTLKVKAFSLPSRCVRGGGGPRQSEGEVPEVSGGYSSTTREAFFHLLSLVSCTSPTASYPGCRQSPSRPLRNVFIPSLLLPSSQSGKSMAPSLFAQIFGCCMGRSESPVGFRAEGQVESTLTRHTANRTLKPTLSLMMTESTSVWWCLDCVLSRVPTQSKLEFFLVVQ